MTGWISELGGRLDHGPELEWVGADGDRVRDVLGSGALGWAIEAGNDVARDVAEALPAHGEGAHFYALRRATTASVLRILLLLSGTDPAIDLVGDTVIGVARDFARRGIEYDDLLRGIRIGYSRIAELILDAADERLVTSDRRELKQISVQLFGQIDQFMGMASEEYLRERDKQTTAVAAARVELINNVLTGAELMDGSLGNRLGYPIDAPAHLAVVAWQPSPDRIPSGPHTPRSVVEDYFASLGMPGTTLIVPVGGYAAWGWKSLSGETLLTPVAVDVPSGLCLATGRPARGTEGFRTSHRQARAIEQLLRNCSTRSRTFASHADHDLSVLLLADIEQARGFAALHLDQLENDDERTAVLRNTLRTYLGFQRSVAQTASKLHISPNTVTYRVQQGFRLANVDPDRSTIYLETALIIYDWLNDQN